MGFLDTLKDYGLPIQSALGGIGASTSLPGPVSAFGQFAGNVVGAFNEQGALARQAEQQRMAALLANAEAGITQPYPGQPTINVLPSGGGGSMPGYVLPLVIGAALLLLLVGRK